MGADTLITQVNSCPSINGYFPQSLRLPVRSTQTGQTQTYGHIAMCPYVLLCIPAVKNGRTLIHLSSRCQVNMFEVA